MILLNSRTLVFISISYWIRVIIAFHIKALWCLFNKYDESWYVCNDEYCYDIQTDDIKYLFGSFGKTPTPFEENTSSRWYAYIVFYKKNGVSI